MRSLFQGLVNFRHHICSEATKGGFLKGAVVPALSAREGDGLLERGVGIVRGVMVILVGVGNRYT